MSDFAVFMELFQEHRQSRKRKVLAVREPQHFFRTAANNSSVKRDARKN